MESVYDKIHFYHLKQKEKNRITKKLKQLLAQDSRIQHAIIFGSLTRRNSIRDIDLCIYSTPKLNFRQLLDLNAQIELDLGIPVDLVELTNLSHPLKLNVLREGIVVKGRKNLASNLLSQTQSEELRKTLEEIKPRAEKRKTRIDSTLLIREDRERNDIEKIAKPSEKRPHSLTRPNKKTIHHEKIYHRRIRSLTRR